MDKDKTREELIGELEELRREKGNLQELLTEMRWKDEFSRLLVATSPAGIYIVQEGDFKLASPMFRKITGYEENELLGMPSLRIVHPEDRDMVRKSAVKMLKKERLSQYEFRSLTKNGEIRWIMEMVASIQFQGKRATLGNFMDITPRKQAEEDLNETKELLDAILSCSPMGIALVENRIIRWANASMADLLGYKGAEALIHRGTRSIFASDKDYEKMGETIYDRLKTEGTASVDSKFRRKGGLVFDGHLKMKAFDPSFPIKRAVATLSDISWRKEAEAAIAAEKEHLTVTLRSIGDGVISADAAGRIILINRVAEDLTGWKEEEAIGRPINEIFNIINEKTGERCDNPVERVLKTGGVVGLANHTVLISRDGTERILSDSGAPIRGKDGKIVGVVLVFRDVTEKRNTEQELQRIEKLESIGVLAGGIAHDFNNMLMSILGNISLAKMHANPESEVFKSLTKAEGGCMQAKGLSQRLLTFSSGGVPVKKTASVAELVRDSVSFALSGSNVRAEFFLPDDLRQAEIDKDQIAQVINNVVINAKQAMPEGGIITVQSENMTVRRGHALPLDGGEYVKITIKDQGIGIPKDHVPKIFDPYFTTKQKGSGLGLATSYSIIKRHDGHISVESTVGVGTSFQIYLPASDKPKPERRPAKRGGRLDSGRGRILLMDDEEIVRNVVGQMLEHLGYEAVFAEDGAEAIELYKKAKESGEPFDAVLMDLTIPAGMGERKQSSAC
ncbi:MAG: PAS domain S-box protein [Deltaproteobacteria bacterium]|nr:PAS domain S-box protein [Deltaproteobacteria bacterium]